VVTSVPDPILGLLSLALLISYEMDLIAGS
jgi:hypothetical protein